MSFGTRHTLSSQTDPKRGIGAALKWTEAEFGRYSRACGGCLRIEKPSDMVTGRRVPNPTRVTNVIAIQRGSVDPEPGRHHHRPYRQPGHRPDERRPRTRPAPMTTAPAPPR